MVNNRTVYCLGDVMFEYIVKLPSLPPSGATSIIDSKVKEVGGPPYNLCFYFSHFKQPCRLVGVFGKTDSVLIGNAFLNVEIDNSTLIRIEGETDFLVVFAFRDYEQYHSFYFRTDLPLGISKEIVTRCEDATNLIITGSRHREFRKAYLTLVNDSTRRFIAFNPSYAITEFNKTELAGIIERSNVTLLNEQEFFETCKILGIGKPEELPEVMSGSLITTLGSKGARLYEEGEIYEIPSLATAVSNVIGAGDAFLAGFLYKKLNGSESLAALKFGNALSSFVVESEEVRVGVSEAEVARRIKTRE